ncbi:MAG: anthranilate synthase component I family protein, partial [Alphaproteobacteria bacterium]|nr:anthranilate synthase component I family protein [Alphaproteobacteria bacterium]
MKGTTLHRFDLPRGGTDIRSLAAAFCARPYTLFFDSADPVHPAARYSYLLFAPFETIESTDGRITITNTDNRIAFHGDPFATVADRLAAAAPGTLDPEAMEDFPFPFRGGAAGLFGYDLARGLEPLPPKPRTRAPIPDMMIGLYNQMAVYDHHAARCHFLVRASTPAAAQERYRHFQTVLRQAPPAPVSFPTIPGESWQALTPRDSYLRQVAQVVEAIYAGDLFQANLSQRFTAHLPGGFDPFAHYLYLRKVNPAPFGAYMNFGEIKIASASPERFLHVANRHVTTCPIKGTRPRFPDDPAQDAAMAAALRASAKDRAENIMIVDLLRNDLSRVCEDHSVVVPRQCALESFAQVHHLVSSVTGTLRADQGPLDLLRACFPGGSITGAPKVQAMRLIDRLEPAPRGPYCGALGMIGF